MSIHTFEQVLYGELRSLISSDDGDSVQFISECKEIVQSFYSMQAAQAGGQPVWPREANQAEVPYSRL